MLKIRRLLGRLIFNMGIAIAGKTVILIETAPWGRQDPGGPHVDPLNFALWESIFRQYARDFYLTNLLSLWRIKAKIAIK